MQVWHDPNESNLACPNPACPYMRKFGRAAEYQSHATICSDCGSALVPAHAVESGASQAQVRPLDELAVPAPATPVEPGQRAGPPIELHAIPGGWLVPVLLMAGGALMSVHALTRFQAAPSSRVSLLLGLGFLLYGAVRLLRRDRTRRRIEPLDQGFVYRAGPRSVTVPYQELRQPRVVQQIVRQRRTQLGYRIELTFEYQGRWWVVGSFARELGEPFETWARAVVSRS